MQVPEKYILKMNQMLLVRENGKRSRQGIFLENFRHMLFHDIII